MNRETVKAVVSMAVLVTANVLAVAGVSVDQGALTELACAIVVIAATSYGCWRNHDFSKAAQEATELARALKQSEKEGKR